MLRFFVILLCGFLVSCAANPGLDHLADHSARWGSRKIHYSLPGGVDYFGAGPVEAVTYPTDRDFPLMCLVAGTGWGQSRAQPAIHQVNVDLFVIKLSRPRIFGKPDAEVWQGILRQEQVSRLPTKTMDRLMTDARGQTWLEMQLLSPRSQAIEARSYVRPVGVDELLLLRLSFGDYATDIDRAQALSVQDRMLQSLWVE